MLSASEAASISSNINNFKSDINIDDIKRAVIRALEIVKKRANEGYNCCKLGMGACCVTSADTEYSWLWCRYDENAADNYSLLFEVLELCSFSFAKSRMPFSGHWECAANMLRQLGYGVKFCRDVRDDVTIIYTLITW